MKIAYLMPNLHPTGGSRVCVEIGGRMAARGHEFIVLVPRGRVRLSLKGGVRVIECGVGVKSPLLAVLTGMAGMAVKIPSVDVIVASMPPYALLARGAGFVRRCPAVNFMLSDDVHIFDDRYYLRSSLLLRFYRALARWSIRRGHVLANSHWTATRCVNEGGVKPRAIVPSGYDPAVFYPPSSRRARGAGFALTTMGRRTRSKGFADAVAALNLIDSKHFPFTLTVITQDELDYTEAKFPIRVLRPAGDVEIAATLRHSDLFLHSSWFEGFGLPPLEAQACGAAVAATDSGGVKEFLRDGHNSLLVPPREPRAFAQAVTRLMADDTLRDYLAGNGLITCAQWTWDRAADRFEATIQRIKDNG